MIRHFDSTELSRLIPGSAVTGRADVVGVSTDTRTLQPGEAYVALRGENFDGHDFSQQAVEHGASLLVADHPQTEPAPQWLVPDTREALGQLGAFNRSLSAAQIVAITGSSGKTTVKEITAHLLAGCGATLATRGNLNNDLGAPRTLLDIGPEHRFAVIELGANHVGEIAYTTRLVQPDVAVVLNAGSAHIAEFGSRENIRRAKGEILEGLSDSGVAILNRDDPAWRQWSSAAPGKVISFGTTPEAEVRVSAVNESDGQQLVQIHGPEWSHTERFPLPGAHNRANLAAAVAVMVALRVPGHLWLDRIGTVSAVPGRMHVRRAGRWTLIDDTYNANPEAVKAAIDVLSRETGPRLLVMGVLAELGEYAGAAYRDIGAHARGRIDQLWTVGPEAALAGRAFGPGSEAYPDNAAVAEALAERLADETGGAILLKGSRSAALDAVVADLVRLLEMRGLN